jgi:hypothetical protein
VGNTDGGTDKYLLYGTSLGLLKPLIRNQFLKLCISIGDSLTEEFKIGKILTTSTMVGCDENSPISLIDQRAPETKILPGRGPDGHEEPDNQFSSDFRTSGTLTCTRPISECNVMDTEYL